MIQVKQYIIFTKLIILIAVASALGSLLAPQTGLAQFPPQPPSLVSPPPVNPNSMRQRLDGLLDEETPGVANPCSPVIFPPIFRGEMRLRPVLAFASGTATPAALDEALDLVGDLGLSREAVVLEWMTRIQVSRFSLRYQYDVYFKEFGADENRLELPPGRWGFDVDFIDRPTLRVGANLDFYSMNVRFNARNTPVGRMHIEGGRPVTVGAHLVYNPIVCGTISGSFEARWRTGVTRQCNIDEVELAVGLKSPQTILGTVGARGGWRYKEIRLEDADAGDVDSFWNAIFGEIVYYY